MEKFVLGLLAATLMLGLSAGPCLSTDALPYKPISEEAVRAASARMYSDILTSACLTGHRYPADQIENGFRRHYEEARLAFIYDGHTIIPTIQIQTNLLRATAPLSQMAFDAKRRLILTRQFGCFRAYWLDD